MPSICPEYMAERCTFSRMRRSVSGVVKAMWQLTCGCTIFLVRKLKGVGSASPGCSSNCIPVDGAAVEARRRAGLEAAGAQAQSAQRFAEQDGGRLAAAAGGVALFAAVDEAVEERAGGDDGGAGQQAAAVAQLEAEDAPRGGRARDSRQFVESPSIGPDPCSWSLSISSMTRSTTSAWRMCRPGWDSSTSRIFTR